MVVWVCMHTLIGGVWCYFDEGVVVHGVCLKGYGGVGVYVHTCGGACCLFEGGGGVGVYVRDLWWCLGVCLKGVW